MPAGVSATAVTEAGDMPNEDLIRAEQVTVGAVGGRAGDPLPGHRLQQLAQHTYQHMAPTQLRS
jgi:hypothetical protein